MVADKRTSAALANIGSLAAGGASWQNRMRRIIVGQSVSHSNNVSVAAHTALFNRIAGTGAGRSHIERTVFMLAFGRVFYLGQTTAGTDFQNLAVNLAGGFPN